jgi:hypothetical protein
MENQNKFNLNTKVFTITEIHSKCPMDKHWLKQQKKKSSKEALNKPWYTVATLPQGVIAIAEENLLSCSDDMYEYYKTHNKYYLMYNSDSVDDSDSESEKEE